MSNDNCGPIPHVPLRKPSAVDVTIGARVRLRRRMVGLTQKAFGDMTFVTMLLRSMFSATSKSKMTTKNYKNLEQSRTS